VPHDLRVISYETIVAGARRHFLRLGTIDMDELAHEFCLLFGTHVPFSDAQLSFLYRNHGSYVSSVRAVDRGNEDEASSSTQTLSRTCVRPPSPTSASANPLVAAREAGSAGLPPPAERRNRPLTIPRRA
jgi:Alpha/beta hydrolase domain